MIEAAILLTLLLSEATLQHPLFPPDDPIQEPEAALNTICTETPSPLTLDQRALPEYQKKSKDGFTLSGTYFCQRTIFDYGERDSFTNYLVEQAESRAILVAQALRQDPLFISFIKNRAQAAPSDEARLQLLQLDVEPTPLGFYIKRVFLHELTKALGTSSVSRQFNAESHGPQIRIRFRRIQDPILALDVRWRLHSHKRSPWIAL